MTGKLKNILRFSRHAAVKVGQNMLQDKLSQCKLDHFNTFVNLVCQIASQEGSRGQLAKELDSDNVTIKEKSF